jgi:hypothetical protein
VKLFARELGSPFRNERLLSQLLFVFPGDTEFDVQLDKAITTPSVGVGRLQTLVTIATPRPHIVVFALQAVRDRDFIRVDTLGKDITDPGVLGTAHTAGGVLLVIMGISVDSCDGTVRLTVRTRHVIGFL